MHSWRNWIACQPPTLKVVGSIPAGCTKTSPCGRSLYAAGVRTHGSYAEGDTRRRSRRSIPAGCTKTSPCGRSLHAAGVRTHGSYAEGDTRRRSRRSIPAGCTKTSPCGRSLHAAGEKPLVRTPKATRGGAAAEVSPPGAPRPPLAGGLCMRQGKSPQFIRRRRHEAAQPPKYPRQVHQDLPLREVFACGRRKALSSYAEGGTKRHSRRCIHACCIKRIGSRFSAPDPFSF